jgi:hypothetical protein
VAAAHGRSRSRRGGRPPALTARSGAPSRASGRDHPGALAAHASARCEERPPGGRSAPTHCSPSSRRPAPLAEPQPDAPRPDAGPWGCQGSRAPSWSSRVDWQRALPTEWPAEQRVARPQAEAAAPATWPVREQARAQAAQRAARARAEATEEAGRGSPAGRRSGARRGTRKAPAAPARRSGRPCPRRRLPPRPHRARRQPSRDGAASRSSRRQCESSAFCRPSAPSRQRTRSRLQARQRRRPTALRCRCLDAGRRRTDRGRS